MARVLGQPGAYSTSFPSFCNCRLHVNICQQARHLLLGGVLAVTGTLSEAAPTCAGRVRGRAIAAGGNEVSNPKHPHRCEVSKGVTAIISSFDGFGRLRFPILKAVLVAMVLGSGIFFAPTVRAQEDPSLVGEWSPVQDWPVVSIHAIMLPTREVLFWRSNDVYS